MLAASPSQVGMISHPRRLPKRSFERGRTRPRRRGGGLRRRTTLPVTLPRATITSCLAPCAPPSYDCLVKLRSLAGVLAFWAVACGELAPETSTPQRDGGKDAGLVDSSSPDGASTKAGGTRSADGASAEADGPSEGGSFVCGDASCRETEVCVYSFCSFQVELLTTDGGSCPDGSADVTGDSTLECIGSPVCEPPFCGPRRSSYDCFDQDGSGPEAILFRQGNGGLGRICSEATRL